MFSDPISIDRLVVRSAARTDPLLTRLRLSHLLQSADFTPAGCPPRAILIMRHIVGPLPISLASFRLDSRWESDVRSQINSLYRRAVRPVCGVVTADGPAVLFADVAEWLACFGLAVQTNAVEQAWYWRASLRKEAISSSLSLTRVWANTPRFVPAAIAHLAEWGRVADVLQLFSPRQANAVFTALADEWGLPKGPIDLAKVRIAPPLSTSEQREEQNPKGADSHRVVAHRRSRSAKRAEEIISSSPPLDHDQRAERGVEAPWTPWLPALEKACEQLPVETQHLLAGAIALFHAPARARLAGFTTQVKRWLLAITERDTRSTAPSITTESSAFRRPGLRFIEEPPQNNLRAINTPEERPREVVPIGLPGLDRVKRRPTKSLVEVSSSTRESENELLETPRIKMETVRFWRDLSGCQTKFGGVLLLVNLFQQMRLPECFDEGWGLSQYISGWGLVELLGKALLGPSPENFHEDSLWTILALLDERKQGESPGASLPDVPEYRMPAEWLKRFIDLEEPWVVKSSMDRFQLWHRSGGFVVVDTALDALSLADQAAFELELYRARGVTARLAPSGSDDPESNSSFLTSLQLIPGWSDLTGSMQCWMSWAFPFLRYLLLRALGDEADCLPRTLLLKTGTVYCSATHVDLVMGMDQITLSARRAGLDANPGWVRDLRRVVSFHFE
jgi:hypothetical protein